MTAFCVKCLDVCEVKDPVQVTMKNGKPAVTGTCPDCGCKVYKMGATLG